MKGHIVAIAASLCLLLSGCVPLESNVENLLQPPKLTDLQSQVDAALREAVGQEFQLKYPKSGQHRSAFNFIDLDGDGTQEAVAFYTLGEDNIQLALLRERTPGDWMVTDIVPPEFRFCTEVDFVSMAEIGGSRQLLVGWGGSGLDNNLLAIYDYLQGTPRSLENPVRWEYSQLSVTDMDQNGQNELLLLLAPDSLTDAPPLAQLVGKNEDGIIDLLDEVELPRNITGYRTPVEGEIGNGLYGTAADCILNNSNLCTLTLAYNGQNLTLPLNNLLDTNLFRQTVRTQAVLSSDINHDGLVDIPVERLAAGYGTNGSEAVWLIDYCNQQDKQLLPVQTAYVNMARGFRFLFPTRWLEQPISVLEQADGSEIIIFLNTSGNLYDHSQELIRFQLVSTLDGEPAQTDSRFFLLGSKGTYLYRAALPTQPVSDFALTREEVTQLFSLIS